MLTHKSNLSSGAYYGKATWENFPLNLDSYISIVRYQVRRFGSHLNTDDRHELHQEGFLAVLESINEKKHVDFSRNETELYIKRKVNSRLKALRREQWKISKVSNRLSEQDTWLTTPPEEDDIEAEFELNAICIQNALVQLKNKESLAVVKKFGLSGELLNAQQKKMKLSPSSINRHSKNALKKLLEDPKVRSLSP